MAKGMDTPVFRFAPSPNGLLHLGHAFSALLNLKLARAAGGIMLLRVEDIDQQRCTPALEQAMLEDLEWIGFEWDHEPVRQSQRFGLYQQALEALAGRGLAYPAFLSRGQIRSIVSERSGMGAPWPADPDGAPLYPGEERNWSIERQRAAMTERQEFAWRLDTEKAMQSVAKPLVWREWSQDGVQIVPATPAEWGDTVLARRDTPTSYHLSCVVDDTAQGVTHVVRGRDLYPATSVHRLLQELLALEAPTYRHHDLILDEDGRKLSKSIASTALRHLRDAGWSAEQVRERIAL